MTPGVYYTDNAVIQNTHKEFDSVTAYQNYRKELGDTMRYSSHYEQNSWPTPSGEIFDSFHEAFDDLFDEPLDLFETFDRDDSRDSYQHFWETVNPKAFTDTFDSFTQSLEQLASGIGHFNSVTQSHEDASGDLSKTGDVSPSSSTSVYDTASPESFLNTLSSFTESLTQLTSCMGLVPSNIDSVSIPDGPSSVDVRAEHNSGGGSEKS